MRARVFTAKQKQIAARVAKEQIDKELQAVSVRTQMCWMAAMFNAGLSLKTVERTMTALGGVLEGYEGSLADGLGDYALYAELKEKGVKVDAFEGLLR